jgi:RNA 3'-terminal phosphate cyclase (ATP)
MLSIDGSFGEGGGQLVRSALALAAITGTAVRIDRVRAGRSRPGLRAQHLTAVRALAEICAAEVRGADLGSQSLVFEPRSRPQPGQYDWEVGTAGSATLIFQAVLWPLAFAPGVSHVTRTGGTHVEWSPPADYVRSVYLPLAAQLAGSEQETWASVSVEQWGWYPLGGGVLKAVVSGGVRFRGWTRMERGSLRSVSVLSAASNLPEHIRQRQADRADFLLRKRGIKAEVEIADPPSPGQGTVVFVLAEYRHIRAGFTAYGRIRKPAEKVAEEACKAYLRYHKRGQPVDAHLGDQLLLPAALAAHFAGPGEGRTRYAVESVTSHLLTQAWVIEQFLDDVQVEIEGEAEAPGVVTVGSRIRSSSGAG